MAKTKISEYSSTANSNTDIASINIDEGCAPSGINNAIRALMAQLKNFQTGADGDSFNGPVGTTTPAAGAFTTLSASGVTTLSAGSASAPALTTSGDTNTGVLFPAADTVGITTGGTERVRVDSSGNVGIGTSSPSFTFGKGLMVNNAGSATLRLNNSTDSVNAEISSYTGGLLCYTLTSHPILFGIGGSEKARIDSSGNLLVGQTGQNSSEKFGVTQSSNGMGIQVRNTNASFSSHSLFVAADRNTTNGSFNYISCYNYGSSGYRFYVLDSGNVQNINNSYGAISDAKLKENVTDTTPKLEKLNQVRIVNYNLIGEQQKQIGVIAQELEAIFPSMVEELTDRDQEGNDLGTTTKSVKYSVFVPMLIKAIQEQQALITQLQADVAALKGQG
jgi:hypothetical protein